MIQLLLVQLTWSKTCEFKDLEACERGIGRHGVLVGCSPNTNKFREMEGRTSAKDNVPTEQRALTPPT